MFTTYIVVTVFAAAMTAFSAYAAITGAPWVRDNLLKYGVPQAWLLPLGIVKLTGAFGVMAGIGVPVIGIAAALALIAYFAGAHDVICVTEACRDRRGPRPWSASRQGSRWHRPPPPDADLGRQRRVVDAFVAAARGGDFNALIEVLNSDVVLRIDRGGEGPDALTVIRGAHATAKRATLIRGVAGLIVRPALVNGAAGIVSWLPDGRPLSVMSFTVARGKIVEIDVFTDPERLRRLDLPPAP